MNKGFLRLRKVLVTVVCCAALVGGGLSSFSVYADTGEAGEVPLPPDVVVGEDAPVAPEEPESEDEGSSAEDIMLVDLDETTYEVDGYILYLTLNDNGSCAICKISEASEPSGSLSIPETLTVDDQNYSVTSITATRPILPDSVRTLALPGTIDLSQSTNYLFWKCNQVEEITLNGVGTVPPSTFYKCAALKKVVLNGDSVTVGNSAFSGCEALTNVILNGATNAIGDYAFKQNTALQEVTVNGDLTSIGYQAFYYDSALQSLTVSGASPTTIAKEAFAACTSLTTIPDLSKVTSLGATAFWYCTSLDAEVDLSGLTTIPDYAFMKSKVTVTAFSDNLTSIGQQALQETTIATNAFADTLETIGDWACYGVTFTQSSLTLPDSLRSVGNNAFLLASGVTQLQIGTNRTQLSELAANAFGANTTPLEKVIIWSSAKEFPTYPQATVVEYKYDAEENDRISDAADALTLQEAVDAANAGDVITISKNVYLGATLTIPQDKRITIQGVDGTTKRITGKSDTTLQNLIEVAEGADVTFQDVRLSGKSGNTNVVSQSILQSSGKVTMGENAYVSDATITAAGKGVIDVSGGNASLELKSGSCVRDNTIDGSGSATIRVSDGASIAINGGRITSNKVTDALIRDTYASSGIQLRNGATATMTSGQIDRNQSARGSAVHLYSDNAEQRSTFTLSGGTIEYNNSTGTTTEDGTMSTTDRYRTRRAGAVYIDGYSDMTMTGGTITHNWSVDVGGGVTIVDPGIQNDSTESKTSFTMKGGSISYNTVANAASGAGGGIYSYSNYTRLLKGVISHNTVGADGTALDSTMGGGVYSEGNSYQRSTVYMANVTIRNNTARMDGGGLWLCETGTASIYDKNGGIIHDNTGTKYGDDVVKDKSLYSRFTMTLSNTTLGGSKVEWLTDEEGHRTEQDRKSITVADATAKLMLKAKVEDVTKGDRIAEEEGLVIEYNTAGVGGGVAANGGVSIGEPGEPQQPEEPSTPGGGGDDGDDDDGGGDNPPPVTPPTPPEEPKEEPVEETPVEEHGERIEGNEEYGYYDEYGIWHFYDEDGNYVSATGDDSLLWMYLAAAIASAGALTAWTLRKRYYL